MPVARILDHLLDAGRPGQVVLDLADVEFVGSTGGPSCRCPSGCPLRKLTRLDRVFRRFATRPPRSADAD